MIVSPAQILKVIGMLDSFSWSAEFIFDVTRTPTRTPLDIPYLDRVRAMCAVMGIGSLKPKDAGHEAIEAAVTALQTGEALQGNAYADALDASTF